MNDTPTRNSLVGGLDLAQLSQRESEQTEWKESVADVDDVVATLTAFANDLQNLGGGYVVCGAREDKDANGFPTLLRTGLTAPRLKEIEGVVLSRCREKVSPPIAPLVEELPTDDPARRILVFVQPATGGAHTYRRRNNGAKHFVRVSRTTIEARDGLLRDLLVRKGELQAWDRRPCGSATIDDIDLLVLREALSRMKLKSRADITSLLSDTEQIHALVPPFCAREPLTGVLRPRNFALLLFGRSPQRFIPGAFAYCSRYPGKDRATDFAERLELAGSLVEQAAAMQGFLRQELTLLMDKTDAARPNVDRYPPRALQEALGNALAHRDYSIYEPTRLTAFADRIELVSPGALPPGITLSQLRRGRAAPRWRNQALAWFFMRLGLAQAEGQGLATIREQLRVAGSPPPRYDASEASVTCVLYAHPVSTRRHATAQRRPPSAQSRPGVKGRR